MPGSPDMPEGIDLEVIHSAFGRDVNAAFVQSVLEAGGIPVVTRGIGHAPYGFELLIPRLRLEEAQRLLAQAEEAGAAAAEEAAIASERRFQQGSRSQKVNPDPFAVRYSRVMGNEPDLSEDFDLVTVFSSDEHNAEMQAQAVQSVLEAGGIPAVIVGSGVIPVLPFEVRVPKVRLEEAQTLLAESEAAGPEGAEEAERASEEGR